MCFQIIELAVSQLKVISLPGLRVRDLQDIGWCANLRVLILSNNFLSRLDPIVHCHQLLKLDLHGNQVYVNGFFVYLVYNLLL
jgi:Leucine-rich repeat (LRR) protein